MAEKKPLGVRSGLLLLPTEAFQNPFKVPRPRLPRAPHAPLYVSEARQ